jgi:hypothetical protein
VSELAPRTALVGALIADVLDGARRSEATNAEQTSGANRP